MPRPKKQQQQQQAKKQDEEQDDAEGGLGDGVEEMLFANVSTADLEAAGLRPHPDKIAETNALASVPVPVVTYKMSLPVSILSSGGISAAQFMAVRLACAKHETLLKDGSRAGFFLGDGPGVGKGRQIAATILENFSKGRTKAVWLSASADLVHDARRDLHDIGALQYDGVRLLDLRSQKAGQRRLTELPGWDTGIMFATYDLLISGEGSRGRRRASSNGGGSRRASADGGPEGLQMREQAQEEDEFGDGTRLAQLVNWFGPSYDGLIVLDECHRAKNCLARENEATDGTRLKAKESKTSRAVLELQRRCRNARVIYVSATGATESENLCYMERLGLWGEGTVYTAKEDFVAMLRAYGVRAMELVAMELKQNGCYLARTLSYEGVKFELVPVKVSEDFRSLYDAAADLWQDLHRALKEAGENGEMERQTRKSMMAQFYGAQLRFFRQLCTAGKVDEVERISKEAIATGKCVVIGLQSTGEARTAAFVAANGGADAVFETYSSETTAQEILLGLINSYLHPDSATARDLASRARLIKLPANPLDDLIQRLGGHDAVAEMTGRTKRMQAQPGGGFKYVARNTGGSVDAANLHEKKLFQDGEKLVAIISDAASTGISLQADRSKPNQRQRMHITLELAWSADKTVQQLGRTHRSNQAQPPLYMLVSSDVSGEHRFASAVAARLMQLGALTHGDRNAVSAVDVLAGSNFNTTYGPRALSKLYNILRGRMCPWDPVSPVYGITPEWLRSRLAEAGLEPGAGPWQAARARELQSFATSAARQLEAVGLFKAGEAEDAEGLGVTRGMMKEKEGVAGGVNRLLNRLLALRIDMQQRIFQYFAALLDAEVLAAKRKGEYETGIVRPTCGDIKLQAEEELFRSEETGVVTRYFEFHADRGIPWAEALRIYENERKTDPDTETHFLYNINSHNDVVTVMLAIERNERGRRVTGRGRGRMLQAQYFRLIRPGTGYADKDIHRTEVKEQYTAVSEERLSNGWLRRRWDEEFNRNREKRQQRLHLISGSLLPLLPTLDKAMQALGKRHGLKVMRVSTSDGRTAVLGISVEGHRVADVLARIRAAHPKNPAAAAQASGRGAAAAAGQGVAVNPGAPGSTTPLPPGAAPVAGAFGEERYEAAARGDDDSDGDMIEDIADGVGSGSEGGDDDEDKERRRARAAGRRRTTGVQQPRRRRARQEYEGGVGSVHVEGVEKDPDRSERQMALRGAGLWEESSLLALRKAEHTPVPATGTGGKRRGRPPKPTPGTGAGAATATPLPTDGPSTGARTGSRPGGRRRRSSAQPPHSAVRALVVDSDADIEEEEETEEQEEELVQSDGEAEESAKEEEEGAAGPAPAGGMQAAADDDEMSVGDPVEDDDMHIGDALGGDGPQPEAAADAKDGTCDGTVTDDAQAFAETGEETRLLRWGATRARQQRRGSNVGSAWNERAATLLCESGREQTSPTAAAETDGVALPRRRRAATAAAMATPKAAAAAPDSECGAGLRTSRSGRKLRPSAVLAAEDLVVDLISSSSSEEEGSEQDDEEGAAAASEPVNQEGKLEVAAAEAGGQGTSAPALEEEDEEDGQSKQALARGRKRRSRAVLDSDDDDGEAAGTATAAATAVASAAAPAARPMGGPGSDADDDDLVLVKRGSATAGPGAAASPAGTALVVTPRAAAVAAAAMAGADAGGPAKKKARGGLDAAEGGANGEAMAAGRTVAETEKERRRRGKAERKARRAARRAAKEERGLRRQQARAGGPGRSGGEASDAEPDVPMHEAEEDERSEAEEAIEPQRQPGAASSEGTPQRQRPQPGAAEAGEAAGEATPGPQRSADGAEGGAAATMPVVPLSFAAMLPSPVRVAATRTIAEEEGEEEERAQGGQPEAEAPEAEARPACAAQAVLPSKRPYAQTLAEPAVDRALEQNRQAPRPSAECTDGPSAAKLPRLSETPVRQDCEQPSAQGTARASSDAAAQAACGAGVSTPIAQPPAAGPAACPPVRAESTPTPPAAPEQEQAAAHADFADADAPGVDGDGPEAESAAAWRVRLSAVERRHAAELGRVRGELAAAHGREVAALREEHGRELRAKLLRACELGRSRAAEGAAKEVASLREQVSVREQSEVQHCLAAEALRAEATAERQRAAAAEAEAEALRQRLARAQEAAAEARRAMEEELAELRARLQSAPQPTPHPSPSAHPAADPPHRNSPAVRAASQPAPLPPPRMQPPPCSTAPQPSPAHTPHATPGLAVPAMVSPAASPPHTRHASLAQPGAACTPAGCLQPSPLPAAAQSPAVGAGRGSSSSPLPGPSSARPAPPSRDDVVAAIESQAPNGITAPALVRLLAARGAAGAGPSTSVPAAEAEPALVRAVGAVLQGLANDMEVVRTGPGAMVGVVNMACSETMYVML